MTLKKAAFLSVLALSVLPRAEAATSPEFGPYSYISNEVSASYAQVSRGKWTWKFLNNSSTTTITNMAFKYVDKNGEHIAVLPSQLKPGASFGGVRYFVAGSRPTISITKIKREVTSFTSL